MIYPQTLSLDQLIERKVRRSISIKKSVELANTSSWPWPFSSSSISTMAANSS